VLNLAGFAELVASTSRNGQREGDEVVQLYTRDLVSSVTTYERIYVASKVISRPANKNS